ncbi:MAG: T9SS type A sorting domain-containing protein, partial [Calditrichia bacterium]
EEQLQPGTFHKTSDWQTDVAFTYGSGFVRFAGNERTQRYAIALAFGNDYADIIRNKRTIQVIYDNDYNFAKAPLQPTVQAVGGDGKVYLTWDDIAERSTDPIYGQDFEAYYIYKSTDPTFNEIKTITDAYGNPLLFKPLAVFDKKDGLKDLHPVPLGSELGGGSNLGISYYMGDDSGLQHYYVDDDVVNGRIYYYAVAALDQGYHPSFYADSITNKENLNPISPTESPANIQIDPLGRPIAYDRNTVQVIPTEQAAGYIFPHLADGIQHTSGKGTGSIDIQILNPHNIKNGTSYRVEFEDNGAFKQYDSTAYTGFLKKMKVYNDDTDELLLSVTNPEDRDTSETMLVDEAFWVLLQNDTNLVDTSSSGWTNGNSNLEVANILSGNAWWKRDYEIRVLGANADTSFNGVPSNFQVWDVTDPDSNFQHSYLYIDNGTSTGFNNILDDGDQIRVFTNHTPRKTILIMTFVFPESVDSLNQRLPENGDVYSINTFKGFDRRDTYKFTLQGNRIDQQQIVNDLDNIYVVPDPYVAVNRLERKVFNPEEGRGQRRIDFVNLPENCTVTIFTVSGRLVQRLNHNATEKNRRLSWDLRTKDGLEIASGMYFYAVETNSGEVKTGKFAVIK